MTLSEIAAGVEVTAEQDDRGVAVVDDAGADLAERLRPASEALPCTPAGAATVVERHAAGASIGDAALAAGVAPTTAAKALHRCGVPGVTPLAPTGRRIVADWLAGDLSRTEALELTGVDEATFALAAYVESHDPDPRLVEAVTSVREAGPLAGVDERTALGDAVDAPDDLR